MKTSITEHFSSLKDPRLERKKLHALMDIIMLVICGIISGAEGWEAIEEFGHEKLSWLRKFVPLKNGVPSHDCIAYVISRLSISFRTGRRTNYQYRRQNRAGFKG